MMQIDSNNVSTYVSYICSDKYYITGQAVRYCLDSGEWDGNDPTCSMYFIYGQDMIKLTCCMQNNKNINQHEKLCSIISIVVICFVNSIIA